MTPPPDSDWRTEVGRFRAAEQRRRHPFGVHVGLPAGGRETAEAPWPLEDVYDAGLRFDLLANLLAAGPAGGSCCWVTRPGVPELHDADLAWFATTTHVFAALGVELLAFRVVTRSGWLDVVSGASRSWRRLRL